MPLAHRIIRSEHSELNLVLACLQQMVQVDRESGGATDFDVLYLILDYIEGFPETFHHPKEEEFLFEAIRRRAPEAGPIIDRLCDEHAQGIELMTELRQSIDAYAVNPTAGGWFRDVATQYIALERAHMQTEEQKIMPLALEVLKREDWRDIAAAFLSNQHPLLNPARQQQFDKLFGMILRLVPGGLMLQADAMKAEPSPDQDSASSSNRMRSAVPSRSSY